jgi:hypothetical protein
MQQAGFDITNLTHIDAMSTLGDPPILLATTVSSALLVIGTVKWLLLWFRLHGTHDRVARIVLICLFCATYLGAGLFQYWFATALYREYYDIGPAVTLGLWVPVAPLWLVGVLAAVIFLLAHAMRRARSSGANQIAPR